MLTASSRFRRLSLLTWVLLATKALLPTAASADMITLGTEVMMEDTAANSLILGGLFQPSGGASLSYNTTMNSDGSYTYSTVTGSTLDGHSISLSGGSTVTTTTPGTVWTWNTYENGDYDGSPYWYVTDKETVTKNPDGSYTIVSDYNYYDPNNNKLGDLHIEVMVDKYITMDTDTGYFTDKYGYKVPMSDFTSKSRLLPNGDWDIEVLPVYPSRPPGMPDQYVGTGYTPPTGGSGYFTATFVPEPSSLSLLALGTLGLLGLLRAGRSR